jgi:NADH-quinone oxidoreductase subunit I
MDGTGIGIVKGLGVTLKHFVNTFVDDFRYAGKRYFNPETFQERQGVDAFGAYTVQYPEEKIAVPERFRFVPFLVVNDYDAPEKPGEDWCTSCGICAKVCPPQCIWIVRGEDPNTGRPIPQPEAFYIDIDICMNCGYCAEFCPFDAIKMDHDYELASYDRTRQHIYDKQKLSKEQRYWNTIAPTRSLEEAMARGGWDHKDVIKDKKKAAKSSGIAYEPDFSVYPGDVRETTGEAPELVAEAVAEVVEDVQIDESRLEQIKELRQKALTRRRNR